MKVLTRVLASCWWSPSHVAHLRNKMASRQIVLFLQHGIVAWKEIGLSGRDGEREGETILRYHKPGKGVQMNRGRVGVQLRKSKST